MGRPDILNGPGNVVNLPCQPIDGRIELLRLLSHVVKRGVDNNIEKQSKGSQISIIEIAPALSQLDIEPLIRGQEKRQAL